MKLFKIFLLIAPLFFLNNYSFSQGKVQEYIDKYDEMAIDLMHETGIPASVILAIAIHETGGGSSRNCLKLNNHFGIKNIKRSRIPGTKKFTAYKIYPSDTASFRHFVERTMKQNYYPALKDNNDFSLWIHTISKSGYARAAKSWKKSILGFIRKYGLDELDWQ